MTVLDEPTKPGTNSHHSTCQAHSLFLSVWSEVFRDFCWRSD